MLIFILIFIQVLLIISIYYYFNGNIFSPPFVFIFGFLIATCCASFFQNRWGIILHFNTFNVYLIGFLIFYIISVSIHLIFRTIINKNIEIKEISDKGFKKIYIHNLVYVIFAIIHLVSILFLIYIVKSTGAMYGAGGDWSESIEKYRYIVAFTNNEVAKVGLIGNLMITITKTFGFLWAYIFIYNIFSMKKKISILALINLLLCIICDFLSGARTGMITIVIALVVDFYVLWCKKNKTTKKLPMKYIVKIAILFLLLIFSFQFLGGFIGRNIDVKFSEYFAKYIGAPIKNLDIFMQESHKFPDIFGQQTFAYLINWIGDKTNNSNLCYNLDLPYINLNGFNMGNVYTTFYMFIYDFGMWGVVYCTSVIAIISQIYFELVLTKKKSKHFDIIIYSLIIPQLILSFFSNKFFETFATIYFIKRLIILRLAILILIERRYVISRNKIIIYKLSKYI